jgi:hypothetical protein
VVIDGYVWLFRLFVVISGYWWLLMVMCGYLWLLMVNGGYLGY